MKVNLIATGWPIYRGADENTDPWIVDSSTPGTVYICYKPDPKRIIKRIVTSSGTTTIEWSYGAWDDRATLTYVPMEESLEVEV